MNYRQDNYYQQEQRNDDYIVVAVDNNRQPIMWEDSQRRLWGYNERNELVEVDKYGREIQYNNNPSYREDPRMMYNKPLPNTGNNFESRMGNSNTNSYIGGSKYGMSGIGGGGYSERRQEGRRSERPAYEPRNKPRNAPKEEIIETEVVNETPTMIFRAGYRPQVGSEMMPYFDESIYELDTTVDEANKIYSFIVKKKDK